MFLLNLCTPPPTPLLPGLPVLLFPILKPALFSFPLPNLLVSSHTGQPIVVVAIKLYPIFTLSNKNFFQSLFMVPTPCHFWRSISKKPSVIPSLSFNGQSLTTPRSKAEALKSFFSSCFNHATTALPNSPPSPPPFPCPPDLLCTPAEILRVITCLPYDTSPGPDGISAQMLKPTTPSISLPASILDFQLLS